MKKSLTKQEAEALGAWFDGRIEKTETEWEAAKHSGGISIVGRLGCNSLAEASKKREISAVVTKRQHIVMDKKGGSRSSRSALPMAAAGKSAL